MDVKRLLLASLSGALLLGFAPGAALAARDRCAQRGSETIASNDVARVFERRGFVFACLRATGRRRALAGPYDDDTVTSEEWSDLVLNDSFVSWQRTHTDVSCKAACPPDYDATSEWIEAMDLRTGSRRQVFYGGTLSAHAVSRTGGLAFLVDRRVLWVADGGGKRVVDTTDIPPASLQMEGSTLTWRTAAGETRSRTVDGGTTCQPRVGGTRAWDDVGRAYDRDGVLYACRWLRNRPRRLTGAPHDHVEMAGRFVAWSEPGTVVVRDLITGREVRPPAGAVLDVALGGDGSVGWLESDGRLFATRGTVAHEVASGNVEPGSLRVQRGVLLWRQDGAERSATVPD